MRLQENLIECRKKKKLSQRQVADFIGVDESLVVRWETGDKTPDAQQCLLLAKLYGMTVDELLYDDLSKNFMFNTKHLLVLSILLLLCGVGYLGMTIHSLTNKETEKQPSAIMIQENIKMIDDFNDGERVHFGKDINELDSRILDFRYRIQEDVIQFRFDIEVEDRAEISIYEPKSENGYKAVVNYNSDSIAFEIPIDQFDLEKEMMIGVSFNNKKDYYFVDVFELKRILNQDLEDVHLIEDFKDGQSVNYSEVRNELELAFHDLKYRWIESGLQIRFTLECKDDQSLISIFNPPDGNVFQFMFYPYQDDYAFEIPSELVDEIEHITFNIINEDNDKNTVYTIRKEELNRIQSEKKEQE